MAVSSKLHNSAAAAPMARYLYSGAITLTDEQKVALDVLHDRIDSATALEALRPGVERELKAEYEQALQDLHVAFEASVDGRAKITEAIGKLHDLDWESFEELTSGLRVDLARAGLADHVRAVYRLTDAYDARWDMDEIEGRAWDKLKSTMDEMREAAFPVQLHASQEMRQLLAVREDVPLDLTAVTRLMKAMTADDERIPGKRYAVPRKDGAEPTACFEITFNADKTISVAHAFASPEDQKGMREAHERAVQAGMAAVGEKASWLRMRDGEGGWRREQGQGAWITFAGDHSTNRLGEPHLHTHAVMLNIVLSHGGRTGAFDLKALHGHFKAGTFDRAYQQTLANELAAIGWDVSYSRSEGVARIGGIPDEVVRAFSQRTVLAEQLAREELKQIGGNFDNLTAEQQAWMMTQKAAETRTPAYLKEVDTEAWEKMAWERGWDYRAYMQNHNLNRSQRAKEAEERRSAGLAGEYHRGGSRELDWGLTSQASRAVGHSSRDWGLSR